MQGAAVPAGAHDIAVTPLPGRTTTASSMTTPDLSAGEFRALYEKLKRTSTWGPEDRKGALGYISSTDVVAAASDVWRGQTVSLGAPVEHHTAADNPEPCLHQMIGSPAEQAQTGLSFAMDRVAMNIHGNADTHIDALCHVLYDGVLYNDVPAQAITANGAAELSIEVAGNGIVGRGLLLDIPRTRGVPWLEPGDHVTGGDLAAAETAQDVHIGAGDLLLVRVGHHRRKMELGPWDTARARAGLHPAALELLAERQIAALGSDGNNDTAASAVEGVDFPVHVLAINALGLHLLDYLFLEDLAVLCEDLRRWSFLCVIAPLRLRAGTGSPVNPIAIF
jgi:kynurenine formamidase